ncbi:MAG: cell division protein FtsI (penicillin-binding protein 3) [Phycisphaerales bacterium]|jgi:cell division protein FtsI (penicillin-binding protein 3)
MIHPPRAPKRERADRFGFLLGLGTTVLLLLLVGRVAQLQIAPSQQLREHVQLRESGRRVDAPRGDIIDRLGRVLATSRWVYRVVIDPTMLPDPPHEAILSLADTIGISPEVVGERVIAKLIENDERRGFRAAMGLDSDSNTNQEAPLDLLRRRIGLADSADASPTGPIQTDVPRLHRYVVIGPDLEGPHADRVRALGIQGVSLERRESREYPGGDLVASIVGKAGVDNLAVASDGWLGAEKHFDPRLGGEAGVIRYARDARGRPLWVEQGSWIDSVPGQSLRLSVDLELQRIAVEELTKGIEAADAAGGRLVMADPETGEILAMVDLYREVPDAVEFPFIYKDKETGEWIKPLGDLPDDPRDRPRYRVLRPDPGRLVHPALGRNRCVEDVYEPGSTFKPFIWSEAKRLGLLPDDEVLRQKYNHYYTPYGRILRDVSFRPELTWDQVLKLSSNIGMAQAAERLSWSQSQDIIRRMGFGRKTNIGLPGESGGIVTSAKNWTKYSQTSTAIGQEIAVTPVQMVRAYCALARQGDLKGTLPELRLTAAGGVGGEDDRTGLTGGPQIIRQVIEPWVVDRVRPSLEGVVERMDANRLRSFENQEPATYNMFGKSGTADIPCSAPPGARRPSNAGGYYENQYNSSFVGAAPTSAPRLVVIVVIDDPGPRKVRVKQQYGSWVAGPVVRSVMERSLRYLGVPPDVVREQPTAVAFAD